MNLSEKISFHFSCNVSPSETPQLYISVTKREPLAIAVPMTIFYSIVFCCGVWTFYFTEAALSCNSCHTVNLFSFSFSFFTTKCCPLMFCRCYSMVWAYWPSSWMLIWKSVPFVSIFSAWSYQVCTLWKTITDYIKLHSTFFLLFFGDQFYKFIFYIICSV